MRILFVSSGNKHPQGSIIINNQIRSLKESGLIIEQFLIKGKGINGYLKNRKGLSKVLRNGNYDLLHSHYSLSAFITTIALISEKKIPHIVSLMGSDIYSKGIYRGIIRYCSFNSWTETIVKSDIMALKLNLLRATVIPNGLDINNITNIELDLIADEKSHQDIEEGTVLFAADPARKEKNYPLAKEATALANLELKVVYNRTHTDIIKEIYKSPIVLLSSKHEGSPNIVKEAMACNRPVVSTDVGDVRKLFGQEPGHYLTSDDPEDVAEKLKQAYEFQKMNGKTRGRDRIHHLQLDNSSIAAKLNSIYAKHC